MKSNTSQSKIREEFDNEYAGWDSRFRKDVIDFFLERCVPKDEVLKFEKDMMRVFAEEITLTHTVKAGKTSRLTSACNRISALLTNLLEKSG